MEGYADFEVATARKPYKTWYQIYDPVSTYCGQFNPNEPRRALVCLHGGPGIPHYYMLPFSKLATMLKCPIIFYDQLGCGNSTRLPEKTGPAGEKFWTPELFLDELDNLLLHLGVKGDYDLLGQSWGGMLAASHATRRPKGLRRLILADSPASMIDFQAAVNVLRKKLPADVQEVLDRCEREGTTETEEYEKAVEVFNDRHLCRLKPTPEDLVRSFAALKEDHTVYGSMNGPSEFTVVGTLKNWDIKEEIHKIQAPTLLINGHYDEAQDSCVEPFSKKIEKVKWARFAKSSHLPQFEEQNACLKTITDFLLAENPC